MNSSPASRHSRVSPASRCLSHWNSSIHHLGVCTASEKAKSSGVLDTWSLSCICQQWNLSRWVHLAYRDEHDLLTRVHCNVQNCNNFICRSRWLLICNFQLLRVITMSSLPGLSPGQTVAIPQSNISQHCWPSIYKLRPNDRNIWTKHITTLLGATCCTR